MKKFISVIALALAVLISFHPASVEAGKMRRIGLLTPLSPLDSAPSGHLGQGHRVVRDLSRRKPGHREVNDPECRRGLSIDQ